MCMCVTRWWMRVHDLVALDVLEHMSRVCFPTQGLLLVVAMGAPESTVHLEGGWRYKQLSTRG